MVKPDITKWKVLSHLDEDFVSNIKLFFVFGGIGQQVIIVTNDDNVYALGDNNGCLGLGHKNTVKEPTKIKELCQKCVVDIQFNSNNYPNNMVLALTRNNEVYSWGSSDCGLLGVGKQTQQSLSPILIKELLGKNVIDIKCGERQCLALTLSGELYYWGYKNEYKPKLILSINGENIKSISCGSNHSMALTDDGRVYSWGNDGLQSDGRNSFAQFPRIVNVRKYINKIQCGPNISLMLSSDGDIYSFGWNPSFFGERRTEDSLIKLKISTKFIDIGATKLYDISVGLSKYGFCYIWGQCGNEWINKPSKTRFIKIIDVLEYCSKIQVTFDRIYYETNYTSVNQRAILTNKFTEKFNKEDDSDIIFKIENNYIYAHKIFLKGVCKHFDVMFSSDYWRECNEKIIEITQYSCAVYYAFIEYLYTNIVNIKPENAIELLDLANAYFEEELKHRCVEIIKGLISIENVFQIFSHGVQYKSEDLKDYCINFFRSNSRDKSFVANILANYTKI